jgi:hypothetical protein
LTLREADLGTIDPFLIWFTDSSFANCDQQRSTGCYAGMFQGGLIDASSFVPDPVTLLVAETEVNT